MTTLPQRKHNRLKGFDYTSSGYYFVTICTKERQECFGDIVDGEMRLNEHGETVKACWLDLPNHYHDCVLDEYVVMPNHVHGIIVMGDSDVGRNGYKPFPTNANPHACTHTNLSEIVRGFKTYSSRRVNEKSEDIVFRWQKSFYDSIIRDEDALMVIRHYIRDNPFKWELELDRNHVANM